MPAPDHSDRPAPGFTDHDHRACVESALAEADGRARAEGLRLTPVRRRVLELLLESHRAMGAYDVLARLDAEGLGSHPPAAYRALDFLTRHGLAHRVERLGAYVACSRPGGAAHDPTLLICRLCGSVAEAALPATLSRAAAAEGFAVEHAVSEAEGVCPRCSDRDLGRGGERRA